MSAPVVGTTAQIVLDGSPYWIVPSTYQHFTPRLRKATPRADSRVNGEQQPSTVAQHASQLGQRSCERRVVAIDE